MDSLGIASPTVPTGGRRLHVPLSVPHGVRTGRVIGLDPSAHCIGRNLTGADSVAGLSRQRFHALSLVVGHEKGRQSLCHFAAHSHVHVGAGHDWHPSDPHGSIGVTSLRSPSPRPPRC